MEIERTQSDWSVGRGEESSSSTKADNLLLPFLEATSEEESRDHLTELISTHAAPVIKGIINYRLCCSVDRTERVPRDPHAEDIYNDVVVHLLTRLNECRTASDGRMIGDLRSYVAVVTYHACHRYLRQKYPNRHSLKNKLRYLLTHQSGFSLWEGEDKELLAGFRIWCDCRLAPRNAEKLQRLAHAPHACLPIKALTKEVERTRPADLLAAIFDYVGVPLILDDLVNVVAVIWGIKDQETEREPTEMADLPDMRPDAETEVEQREYLQQLWSEILQLPVAQRTALLLNLKDAQGRGCITLFPLTGVATMRHIAEALEMPAANLAELWKSLPLDDHAIATRLALTRQQVINLRKSARERLARRLKAFR